MLDSTVAAVEVIAQTPVSQFILQVGVGVGLLYIVLDKLFFHWSKIKAARASGNGHGGDPKGWGACPSHEALSGDVSEVKVDLKAQTAQLRGLGLVITEIKSTCENTNKSVHEWRANEREDRKDIYNRLGGAEAEIRVLKDRGDRG